MKDYNGFAKLRTEQRGVDVCICVSDNLTCTQLVSTIKEIVAIEIIINKQQKILVINSYFPNKNQATMWEKGLKI